MRLKAALLTLLVAVTMVGCTPSAPQPESESVQPSEGITPSPRSSDLAGVLGTGRFTSVSGSGDAAVAAAAAGTTFQVWLGQQNGTLTLSALGPINIASVPVTARGAVLTPDVSGLTGSAAGCATDGGPDCVLDGWLSAFIAEPLTAVVDGDDLRLSGSSVSAQLRRDSAAGSRTRSNGRTLLTYPATGGGDQALLKGVLGENAAGCVTIGGRVLIAPDTTRLLPDGSLALGGTDLVVGDRVQVGGGGSRRPGASPCGGAGVEYFTVGDYSQS